MDVWFRKTIMETADCYYLQQNHQQLQPGCGLMQYRSAPTSLLQNHVLGIPGVIGSSTGFDEYVGFRSSSSRETETLFMLSGTGSSDMQEYEEKYVRKESEIPRLPMQGVGTDVGLGNSMEATKMGNGIGFNGTKSTTRACNGDPKSTSRLYNNHISFSSMPSSYPKSMPQTAQVVNQSLGSCNGDLFCGLSKLQTQNESCRDYSTGLTHHLSLPKMYQEMDVVEKLWQFQGLIPRKIRAKRGCATHPRSIAERVRRTRISERMKRLQGLFPNIDKQTNTADMLDMAVEYIKDLQRQVKTLRDTKAKCKC